MKLKSKVIASLGAVALICSGLLLRRATTPVLVFHYVPTNPPPFIITQKDWPPIATNNWVTEGPLDSNKDTILSASDITAIKRLGILHGWWPPRMWLSSMDRIVIRSDDMAWIDYPTGSLGYVYRLTVVKQQEKWKITQLKEWPPRDSHAR